MHLPFLQVPILQGGFNHVMNQGMDCFQHVTATSFMELEAQQSNVAVVRMVISINVF